MEEACAVKGFRSRPWPIIALLTAFFALGALYSVTNPLFESPDEPWHFLYVKHIVDTHTLPVQDPLNWANTARQERSQPPLYYLSGALFTLGIDTRDAPQVMRLNPNAAPGQPQATGNKNVFYHTRDYPFPYQGTALAAHILRWLSLLMGTATVFLTYLIARQVFPSNREIALGAAAINAFIPQYLFISASVNNDNLVIALSSFMLLLLIQLIKGARTPSRLILTGSILGLAFLSKLTALGLAPLVVGVLLHCSQRSLRVFFRSCMLVFTPALVIAGWWYVRNWLLYEDALGLSAMLRLVGERQASLGDIMAEMGPTNLSFWATFGWSNILASPWVYGFFQALALLSIPGLIVFLTRQRRVRSPHKDQTALLAVLLAWTLIVTALLIRWLQTTAGSQGRLLFPAISALSIFMFLGLANLMPQRLVMAEAMCLAAVMLTIATASPFLYIMPSYQLIRTLPTTALSSIPHRLRTNFGGQIELVGYSQDTPTVEPGGMLRVTLYWRALTKVEEDYTVFVHLLDADGKRVGQSDSPPLQGRYPTTLWTMDEIIPDASQIRIDPATPWPQVYRLHVGLYSSSNMERLPAYDESMKPLGNTVPIASVKVALPHPPQAAIGRRLDQDLEDKVQLVGYDLDEGTVRRGQSLSGRLYWRAKTKLEKDYTVFVQLIRGDRLIAQYDSQPRNRTYPTSSWDTGELVTDYFRIDLPGDAPPGEYSLIVGMYEAQTRQRLSAGAGSHIDLDKLNITD